MRVPQRPTQRYIHGIIAHKHRAIIPSASHSILATIPLSFASRNLPVKIAVEGVLDPAQVVQRLSASHVLLFIRGHISSRQSSAIAGIACGLPVLAISGSETAPPLTDAGVVLVPPDQQDQLNDALVRILSDATLRSELAARSRAAYQTSFSWAAISARFAALLRSQYSNPQRHSSFVRCG